MNIDFPLRYLIWLGFTAYSITTLFYISYMNQSGIVSVVGMFAALLSVSLVMMKWLPSWGTIPDINHSRATRLLWIFITFGVLLRVGFILIVPPVQLSDMLDYWNAALRVVNEGRYYYDVNGHELLAWRPPGYPFLLAAFIAMLGDSAWIPLLINLICFVLLSLASYGLAHEIIESRRASIVVVALLAVWPGSVVGSGLAATENTSLCLMSVGLWAYLRALNIDLKKNISVR